MSGSDPTNVAVPHQRGAVGRPSAADRVRTVRRWAVGVLLVGTSALAGYLAMVLLAAWLVGSAIEALSSRELGSLDVAGVVVASLPGLATGWGAGLAATRMLGRGEGLGARAAGVASGSLGILAGAAVLAMTDVL